MKKAPRISALMFGLTVLAAVRFTPTAGAARRPAALTADETWTIPGAGSVAGLNNTRFVSDLALTNLGSGTASVTVSFVGPGGLPPKPITLAAGATTVYRDVLDQLWAATGLVGALSVRSDQPLVLRARTYNTAATGTFGVAIPAYASGQLLEEGQTADSIWVQQSVSGSSGFRTNVGVVFPDAAGGDAVVTLFDASGAVVGTLNFSSASAGFQQLPVSSVAPGGLSVGRAQISVTRGHAAGYAVGVDNVTGDTSLYPLEALPAGVQDVVVSGVARLNGRNNTFFRTDARFYNPTPADATVTARFHAGGSSNPTAQSATVTVPAGRVVEVVDVLGSILSLPVGSGGAVRFTADQPVAILCRTSNVDPQGVQPGTFGAQQRPVPLASYLSSADAGAVVTAIRQDTSFRTNVGFASGPDGATYRLTLKSAPGTSIAGAVGSLGAFGWAQPSIADLFPGTAVPADATLLVEVTSGTVDVYDASLDNSSGDLVVTPIAPVPAALPTSASIGPSGGSIRSADGRLTLKVPAGALAAPTTLSISPTANTAPNAIGSAYALTPVGLAFARPAQVVFAYSDADLDNTGAGALGIASQDGNTWYGILGGSVDPVARALFVPLTSTSPGPATAGNGRVPMRASAPGNLGPYGSVRITPTFSSVEEKGHRGFVTSFVGPASSWSTILSYVGLQYLPTPPANVQMEWYVAGVRLGNGVVGTILTSAGGAAADYRAPDCVPPLNPVTIKVTAQVPNGPSTVIRLFVRVIPTRWVIDVIYSLDQTCATTDISLSWERSRAGSFTISNGQVGGFVAHTRGTGQVAPAWCPGFNTGGECTQPVLTDVDVIEVTSVTGALIGSSLNPYFDLTLSADIPGTGVTLSWVCTTGSGSYPASRILARSIPTQNTRRVSVSYPSLEWASPTLFTGESVKVVLTPQRCP